MAGAPFHLAYFLTDAHAQAWAKPWSGNIGTEWASADLYVAVARELERAAVDYVLIEDNVFVADAYGQSMDIYLQNAISVPRRDPLVVASFMLQATRSIGVVPTVSTFAYQPYLLARQVGSLDQLSAGRAGWNVVTGSSHRAWQNFGYDAMAEHDNRYDIAEEFVQAAFALWDSWAPDAILADRLTGQFADPARIRLADYSGDHYATRGPVSPGQKRRGLNECARPRQVPSRQAEGLTEDTALASGGCHEPQQHGHRRRLACTVGSDEARRTSSAGSVLDQEATPPAPEGLEPPTNTRNNTANTANTATVGHDRVHARTNPRAHDSMRRTSHPRVVSPTA